VNLTTFTFSKLKSSKAIDIRNFLFQENFIKGLLFYFSSSHQKDMNAETLANIQEKGGTAFSIHSEHIFDKYETCK